MNKGNGKKTRSLNIRVKIAGIFPVRVGEPRGTGIEIIENTSKQTPTSSLLESWSGRF